MPDVFISYARSDRARVAPLVAAIEAQGWSVWWDPAIAPGQEFDRQIGEQLERAATVLVVWTPKSVASRWVRGEARHGADRGVMVPVRFDGAELPIDARAFHTTDLDPWPLDESSPGVQEMLRALGTLINRDRIAGSTPAPPSPLQSVTDRESGRATMCVLPLTNMSADTEQQYLCDGITEDIITELSRWRRLLAVRSRSASFRYRGGAVDMKNVARELNVRFIVEGSVRRMAERIRITVQLIDAETGRHVWAEKFDRAQDEIFAVQDRVVQTIVSTLVGRVEVSDAERARRKPPTSLVAYECVLKGNSLSWDDPAGAEEAARLFERAIKLDPEYAIAHALLSALACQRWQEAPSQSDADLEDAYRMALRAVELDAGESTCHAMLGHVCRLRRSFELAEQHTRRAIEVNPNNQWNAADLGAVLTCVGKAEEALVWLAKAREIDPYFEPPTWYWRAYGLGYMVLRRYADALSMLSHVRVRPYQVAALMAACHAEVGEVDRARRSVAECLSMKPDFSITQFIKTNPFKDAADEEQLASSLRLAGLPE